MQPLIFAGNNDRGAMTPSFNISSNHNEEAKNMRKEEKKKRTEKEILKQMYEIIYYHEIK